MTKEAYDRVYECLYGAFPNECPVSFLQLQGFLSASAYTPLLTVILLPAYPEQSADPTDT
jgi:hypothetical protein